MKKNELVLQDELISWCDNSALVKKVIASLPELNLQTRMFDRTNSQATITMMTLTMLNGQSPYRMLRQILAEVEKRKTALYDAHLTHAKLELKIAKLEEKEDRTKIDTAKLILLKNNIETLQNKANGSMKDIAILADAYDSIKEKNNIDQWDEESFENEEKAHHIRRGFEMLYRNLIEYNHGKEATLEYLQQFGVHIQLALIEVGNYINEVEDLIRHDTKLTSLHLEEFLDEMRDKYVNHADEVSERLFNKRSMTNKEYMTRFKRQQKEDR
jgi:hypothetical protein